MLSLAIAGIVTLRIAYKYYYSQPNPFVTFLDRPSTQKFFADDSDRYFHNHNSVNLIARGYDSVESLIHHSPLH
jgi:hypothetical protein